MMKRMWINQPSTLQPHHKLHGEHVLVAVADWNSADASVRAWFTRSDRISQQVDRLALSEGWPDKTPAAWRFRFEGPDPVPDEPSRTDRQWHVTIDPAHLDEYARAGWRVEPLYHGPNGL